MRFTSHPRTTAARNLLPAQSRVWENALLGVAAGGLLMFGVLAVDAARAPTPPPAPDVVASPVEIIRPDKFDNLPATAAQIEAAKAEAQAHFKAAWAPATLPRTTGGFSLGLESFEERRHRLHHYGPGFDRRHVPSDYRPARDFDGSVAR